MSLTIDFEADWNLIVPTPIPTPETAVEAFQRGYKSYVHNIYSTLLLPSQEDYRIYLDAGPESITRLSSAYPSYDLWVHTDFKADTVVEDVLLHYLNKHFAAQVLVVSDYGHRVFPTSTMSNDHQGYDLVWIRDYRTTQELLDMTTILLRRNRIVAVSVPMDAPTKLLSRLARNTLFTDSYV